MPALFFYPKPRGKRGEAQDRIFAAWQRDLVMRQRGEDPHHGPLVKRLRRRPLTAKTGVRFSQGSPFFSLPRGWGIAFTSFTWFAGVVERIQSKFFFGGTVEHLAG